MSPVFSTGVITVLSLGSAGAAGDDDLLAKYETGDKEFIKRAVTDNIIYWHQRMIDEAFVEFDYIRYVFDKNTGELVEKDVHWRDDLPEHLPPIISSEEAEAMVEGEIYSTSLWYISPESVVFPIKPTPKNPCWAVRILGDNGYIVDVIVIDAVEGKIVGHGVPPPSEGYVLSGPTYLPPACSGYYQDFYYHARNWFEEMGYPTETALWPSEEEVESYIQNNEIAMFYEVAHGGSQSFWNQCYDCTTAGEVESWIEDYPKMPFTFLASCNGICNTGPGTLSYAFRKGSMEDTATVGCCGMGESPCADECWPNIINWQGELLWQMRQGDTVKEAFDKACFEYDECEDCMRFVGDEDFAVVPVVHRGQVIAEIPLSPDWNLVSLPLIPDDNDIEVVLADIMDNVSVVQYYDAASEEWLWYIPGNPASTLTTMEDGLGYWFFMNSSDTLTVSGLEAPLQGQPWPAYDVFEGWNMIGFKSTNNMHHTSYLYNIAGDYSVIWGWDAGAQEYFSVYPLGEHGGNMEPGHGYWLWATADGTIVPPEGDGGSKSALDGDGAILPDKAHLPPPVPPLPPLYPPYPPLPPSSYTSGVE